MESTTAHQNNEAEHTLITASLDLEQLDANLFRSAPRSLWMPSRARGVFGGQVISQALVAASKTVGEGFHCHSLHCYFLQSADASIPIVYYVDIVRQGRSFLTRGVKAAQRGRSVFVMMTSFSKVEVGHPVAQWPSNFHNVKPPELCQNQADRLQSQIDIEKNADRKEYFRLVKEDRLRSPIEIRIADDGGGPDGKSPAKYWMRARNIEKMDSAFQKCILAYISDLNFLPSVARAVRHTPENGKNTSIAMMASLDHTLWFYDHEFDCREWLLFVMDSPRVGLGRGCIFGHFYNQEGKMIATAAQEGVARGPGPKKKKSPQRVTVGAEVEAIEVKEPFKTKPKL